MNATMFIEHRVKSKITLRDILERVFDQRIEGVPKTINSKDGGYFPYSSVEVFVISEQEIQIIMKEKFPCDTHGYLSKLLSHIKILLYSLKESLNGFKVRDFFLYEDNGRPITKKDLKSYLSLMK